MVGRYSVLRSEHLEQVEFVQWFRMKYPEVLIFAIPNGGYRSKILAGKLKAEGVVAGIPDLFIPEWGLWIEMKKAKGGRLSENQKTIISILEKIDGHKVIVAHGFESAKEKLMDMACL